MKLESIKITNFKSFKGNHIISNLDNHFTAIVGPNGSGKSNIIDSILFVLGYRAKKMRHSMLKDLITTGCSECNVELVFSNFKVCRQLKSASEDSKNCVSKYFLNDELISIADLMIFLKEKGIDLENNRFLILQGEIENISMMGPLDLLGYIEDCIGTSNYKEQIDALEGLLVDKENEIEIVGSNLKFVETDYLYKKGKRDEKVSFLNFKNDSLVMKNNIISMKNLIAERKAINLEREREDCSIKLNEIQIRNEEALNKISVLENERGSTNIGSLKECEDNLLKAKRELQKYEKDSRFMEAKKERIENEILKTNKELMDEEKRMSNWKVESKSLKNTINENGNEIMQMENELSEKTAILETFEIVKNIENNKIELKNKLLNLMKEKDKFEKIEGEIEFIKGRISEMENEKIEQPEGCEEEVRKEVETLMKDMRVTEEEIGRRRSRAVEYRAVEMCFKREREVIDALNDVPGVYGPLSVLGRIESGFEVAVEAATKSLNSIVVESTSVAETCIGIINKGRLNRTTFIILDKLIPFKSEHINIDHKGGYNKSEYKSYNSSGNLLWTKIQTEDKFKNAFYFALKDTLVVQSMEEAKVLAFGQIRQRVVTIDGKLLEKSGIMSGGKVKKLKSVEELEHIYKNMKFILEGKQTLLTKFRNTKNEAIRIKRNKQIIKQLREELFIKESERSCIKDENSSKTIIGNNSIIENNIKNIKNEIQKLENFDFPIKIKIIQGELQILVEKIEYLEKVNQELKIKLSCQKESAIENLNTQLAKLIREKEGIVQLNKENLKIGYDYSILPQKVEALELEYNNILKEHKLIQSKISTIRNEMGNDYHEEAELKNRIEEIADLISECLKIKNSCANKSIQILTEYKMIQNLLDGSQKMIQNSDYINELNDEELKQASRSAIEELNNKESENFNKLKSVHKINDTNSDENDISFYKAIFNEYESSKIHYESIKGSFDYLKSKLETMKQEHTSIKSQRYSMFMDGFTNINRNLKEIFKMITFGGNAELDLVDCLNPFSDGIVLSIMPPKKSWKQIANLSGGEKTLSSLSLIFSLHKFRPSAFYIMDEIDAALDFKNVSVISQYLSKIQAQFIIISLRNDMFEMAKTLLGVYKVDDQSRVIMVKVDELNMNNKL